jgi:hypothetical protein
MILRTSTCACLVHGQHSRSSSLLAIHQCAPKHAKPFTQVALGWMLAAAAFTTVVHFVQLTVARQIESATFPGYARIFGWQWPSTFYAIDIVAWDVFFGLALLFAVPAFTRKDATLVRRGLTLSGLLCLIGLVGPFANVIGLRTIGIARYTVVLGLTCLPLRRTFKVGTPTRANPGAARPSRPPSISRTAARPPSREARDPNLRRLMSRVIDWVRHRFGRPSHASPLPPFARDVCSSRGTHSGGRARSWR